MFLIITMETQSYIATFYVYACSRANGNRGVHVTIPVEDKHTIEFYYRWGKENV